MRTAIKFAAVMLLFCSSSVVWADNIVEPETKEKKEVKQTPKPKEEEPIKMYCVVTSCNGIECDPKFKDVEEALKHIDKYDNCYD